MVVGHQLGHMPPPFAAFGRASDSRPFHFALDLRVGEQLACLRIVEDRIVPDTVRLQYPLQVRPDGIVTPLVLGFGSVFARFRICARARSASFLATARLAAENIFKLRAA